MQILDVSPSRSSTLEVIRNSARLAALVLLAGFFVVSPLPLLHADPIKRKLLDHPDPAYPPGAKRMRIEGSVILRLVIEADGHVSSAEVASGNPMLTGAAQDAAKQWKYSPAPEATSSVVQVNFNLK